MEHSSDPPDPHRCFSDLPTAPQGPFKGPKPREQTHRDFIEPWTGLGPGTGLSPPLATNGYAPRLTCIFPEKKVRALSLLARLYQQVQLLLLLLGP